MALQSTDLFMVSRGGGNYKVEASELVGGFPVDLQPGDITFTPTVPGTGTELDPYVLSTSTMDPAGGTIYSAEQFTISNQSDGSLVNTVDLNVSTNGARYTQPVGVINNGVYTNNFIFHDTPETTDDIDFVGSLKIGSTYFEWEVAVLGGIKATIKKPEVLTPPDGSGIAGDVDFYPETSEILTATETPITSSVIKSVTNSGTTSTLKVDDGSGFDDGDNVEADVTFNATSGSVSNVSNLTDTFTICSTLASATINADNCDCSDVSQTTITGYESSYTLCRSTTAGKTHTGTLGPSGPDPSNAHCLVWAGGSNWALGWSSGTANKGGTWVSTNDGASWSYTGQSQMSSDRFLSPTMYSNRRGQVVVFYGNGGYRYGSTNSGASWSGRWGSGVSGTGTLEGGGYLHGGINKWVFKRGNSTYLQTSSAGITSTDFKADLGVGSGVSQFGHFCWHDDLVNPFTGIKGCMYAFGNGAKNVSFTHDGENWDYKTINNGKNIHGATYIESIGKLCILMSTANNSNWETGSIGPNYAVDGTVDPGVLLNLGSNTIYHQRQVNMIQYNRSADHVIFYSIRKTGGDPVYAWSKYGGLDGTQLNFSTTQGLSDFEVGMDVTSEPAGATAKISAINTSSVIVDPSTGSWPGKQMKGPDLKGTGVVNGDPSFNGTEYTVSITGSNGEWVADSTTKILNKTSSNVDLTLTDGNTYSNGTDMNLPIDETFTMGQTVRGLSTTTTYGVNSPAFATKRYSGDRTEKDIVNGIDNTNGGMVWLKERTGMRYHHLFDTARGVNNYLNSNTTNAASNSGDTLPAFNSNGFRIGSTSGINATSSAYVSWNFRAAPGFFDIVTYVGNNAPAQSVRHQLSTEPGMMIVKNYSSNSTSWTVYHKALGASYYGRLSDDSAFVNDGKYWNSTEPTADEFTVGQANQTNADGEEYVAYLFADTPGTIKCGKLTAISGTVVNEECGFKPAWVMLKRTESVADWDVFDAERLFSTNHANDGKSLFPNTDDDEGPRQICSVTNTGFTINSYGAGDVIYVAIAENAMAGEFAPTGELTADADVNGPSMTLTNTKGDWTEAGLKVVNDTQDTAYGPDPDSIIFTSSEPKISQGAVTTWGQAKWELSTSSDFSTDYSSQSVLLSEQGVQTGPNFSLEKNQDYYVRTQYTSAVPNVSSEVSKTNHFKTSGSAFGGGFSATLYSGTTAVNPIETGVDNSVGSLVWIKSTDFGTSHNLFDNIRDIEQSLSSDTTSRERNFADQGVTSFDSSGFTLGTDSSYSEINVSGRNYVAWNFKSGPGFFDIVAYDGSSSRSQSHSLGTTPGMIIVKCTTHSSDWSVWHTSLNPGIKDRLKLNSSNRSDSDEYVWGDDSNPVDMNENSFSLGFSGDTNASGKSYVAYLFANNPDAGIVCGTYQGTALAQTIDCGFKPAWVMIKSGTTTTNWRIYDNQRDVNDLIADGDGKENDGSNKFVGFSANGFDLPDTTDVATNQNGRDYVFMAVAESVDTTSFFDTINEEVIKGFQITDQYGIEADSPLTNRLSISELTEQPTGPVQAFVPQGDKHHPIPDLTNSLSNARADAAEANARLDTANETIAALQADFEARISALEAE